MQQDTDPSALPEQPPDSTLPIKHVGIHIPPFWPEKPAMWFAQLDGQFALSDIILDMTKFYYVILQLDNKYAAEVEDIITNPRYDRMKAELIRCLSLSEEQHVCQLLMHEEMGDRRPTQFLCHLRTLAGSSVPSDFLRTLWTNRLPPNIQAIIATQAQVALDDVAQLVDKIAEVTPPPCVTRVASSDADILSFTARIDELAQQVTALTASPSRPRLPSQTQWHARHPSRSAARSPAPDICWYHCRFKERAKRCTVPCMWQQGNAKGGR